MGGVILYTLKPVSKLENLAIEKKTVKKKDRQIYWDYLDSIVSNQAIYLDSDELSKPPFPNNNDSVPESVSFVQTGRTCILFFQGNKYLGYCVLTPALLKLKTTQGLSEKLIFFDLYNGLFLFHHSPRHIEVE